EQLPVRPLEVMFNYMGQMDAEAKGRKLHFFSSGKGSADENTVFRKISVNGGIMDGKLQLVIGYNRSYLSSDRMQSFSERYMAALLAVKDHCIAIKESVRTPSDYRAADLTRTDLSVIQQAVGGSSQVERIYGLTSL
ncbi:hypothetical protein P4H65_27080, partial [Paenibacillus chitinolyticus]|uniref:hypothetical protein n=1 Tax=Paenibacillus chitinolyticus TaxID=79263 RepID=UPI002DB9338C